MKTQVHRASDRGFANYGWLQANYSFSFANFFNPEKIHFGALRVLNDDLVAPKMGFGTHPHDNMEIITIPMKGELKHRDSMHNEWQSVHPGEVQVMSAGTGISHSEINGSTDEHLSLFQIWIMPEAQNLEPRYDQKTFDASGRQNKLQTLVTSFNDSNPETLKINQDARLSRADLDADKSLDYSTLSGSHGVYVLVMSGEVEIEGVVLNSRDAIGISETGGFKIDAKDDSEILFIEVPMISLN